MNSSFQQGAGNVSLAAVASGLPLGGSTTFLVNLGLAFRKRGDLLPIVSMSEMNDMAADFARIGQPVHCVPGAQLIYEDRLGRGYAELSRYAPRAVLSCLGAESFEVLRLVPGGVGRLGIVQSHDPGPYTLMKQYAPHLDAAVGVSQEITRHLAAMPELSGVRVECIPYGIAFEGEAPLRDVSRTAPLRVVYLGRLIEEQKRVSRVAELIRRVHGAGLPAEFTFVGNGPAEQNLRAEFADRRDVRFTGPLQYEQVRPLLAEQDVFVLLSDFEGLPLSLLEAMGQGVVPLVSDLPSGMRDVVGDDCGFRVRPDDVAGAHDIIAQLCREPARLRLLSERSSLLARREYSADRMAERYRTLVAEIADAPASWPPRVHVPAPYGVKAWLFRGLMRRVRRKLKPWLRRR